MDSILFSPQRWQQGKHIGVLEESLANYLSLAHSFAFASEETALAQVLKAWEIGGGDKVAVSAWSPKHVAEGIRRVEAVPRFIDIDEKTFNLDVEELVRLKGKEIKAVVVHHAFGQPADLGKILPWARENKMKVMEDCGCALGARYRGELIGTFGDAVLFSFDQESSLVSAGGGAVAASDPRLARTFVAGRGRLPLLSKWLVMKSFLGKLPAIESPHCLPNAWAAIAYQHLVNLDERNRRRREIAACYLQQLRDIPAFKLPQVAAGAEPSFRHFAVRVPDPERLQRSAQKARIKLGYERDAIVCLPLMDRAALGYGEGLCPTAEKVAQQVVLLPTSIPLVKARKIVRVVREHYRISQQPAASSQ